MNARKYDYALVAVTAREAHEADRSMSAAVASALGCSVRVASTVISKARGRGFDIPGPGHGGRRGSGCRSSSVAVDVPTSVYFEGVELAACVGVDPDLFFPERGASTKEAKAVCAGCVVREACLEYAIVNAERFGIWGGKSERERRRIRSDRFRARQAGAA